MRQFNCLFNQLLNQCLDEVKQELLHAKTQKEKILIAKKYGFDLDDFIHETIRRTDDVFVEAKVDSHVQRAADFLGKAPKTIYNHKGM